MSPKLRGLTAFVGCVTLGVVLTGHVRDHVLRDWPRFDVSEAAYRDGMAVRYTLLGWLATAVLSVACGFVAARTKNGRGP